MLILGIDPGTATTGFGLVKIHKIPVIDTPTEGYFETVKYGLIETDKESSASIRLQKIFYELNILIDEFKPTIMAIEKVFFATNAKTAIRVGQAQGVMLMCAATNNIEVVEYSPMTIKKVITGSGRADKKQVQSSIKAFLGDEVVSLPKKKTHFDNAADALAVALCHAYTLKEL